MYENQPLISDRLREGHEAAWQTIGRRGDFFTASQRIAMVAEARQSLDCDLCLERKAALSPAGIEGEHGQVTDLADEVVEVVHRIRTDPQRLTKSWFDGRIAAGLSQEMYLEVVSVVVTSVIVDTLHNAMGLGVPQLPIPQPGEPKPNVNADVVDGGAWVPILAADNDMADTGLPRVPNIARALGLLPNAMALFFGAFRPHYALKDISLSISQAQAEFVASRVSSLNECFY